jgi:hypothetical protein
MVTLGLAECGGTNLLSASILPLAPSSPAADPCRNRPGLRPALTAVSPNVVSTAGTWGTITGTGFEPGATVKISGAAVWGHVPRQHDIAVSEVRRTRRGSRGCHRDPTRRMAGTLPWGNAYAAAESFDAMVNGSLTLMPQTSS